MDAPDTPDVLAAMDRYLTDYDAALRASPDAQGVIDAMKRKYPDYVVPGLLEYSARTAYAIWRH